MDITSDHDKGQGMRELEMTQETGNQHRGFETELKARVMAAADMPGKHVTIIESSGEFYVETDDTLIRSWERECYSGLGIQAVSKNATECGRCGRFMKKRGTCPRCGANA